jgi:molybdopterin/thiamine biosynthesis adenylyltransferase
MQIHIDSTLMGRVQGHLRRRKTEQVAFLFARATGPQILTACEIYLVPSSELVHESRFHAEISEEVQAKIIKMAADKSLLLVEVHSHPGCEKGAGFSPSDLAGFREFVPHIFWRLRVKEYAALVFGDHDYDALAWMNDPVEPAPFSGLVVSGNVIAPTGVTIRELERQKREAERYSRQIAMLGKEGQVRIGQVSVVIVGVGGLASHIIQQLAYAGVKKYFLVDMDRVDRTNLNRFVIGTETDLGRLKAEVAGDFIRRVQPNAEISIIPKSVISGAAFDAVSKCSIVFGCVDNDGPRLALLELCCSLQKPYIDVATDVPTPGCFGGRMVFTGIGKGCLACREELDQSEVRRFFSTPEQRIEDDKIYGIDRSALGVSGPSVVFLNGILASLAVTEFTTFITGLRAPLPHLTYRGEMGIVTTTKAPEKGCYYCDSLWTGESIGNPERYLNLKG